MHHSFFCNRQHSDTASDSLIFTCHLGIFVFPLSLLFVLRWEVSASFMSQFLQHISPLHVFLFIKFHPCTESHPGVAAAEINKVKLKMKEGEEQWWDEWADSSPPSSLLQAEQSDPLLLPVKPFCGPGPPSSSLSPFLLSDPVTWISQKNPKSHSPSAPCWDRKTNLRLLSPHHNPKHPEGLKARKSESVRPPSAQLI